jgi:hypothetical protein
MSNADEQVLREVQNLEERITERDQIITSCEGSMRELDNEIATLEPRLDKCRRVAATHPEARAIASELQATIEKLNAERLAWSERKSRSVGIRDGYKKILKELKARPYVKKQLELQAALAAI